MGKKYIIEKDDNESIWSIYADADGDATIEGVSLTPYTEPDMEQVRKEAYENGYENGFVSGHLKAEKSGQSFYEDGYQRDMDDANRDGEYNADDGWYVMQKISLLPNPIKTELFGTAETAVILQDNSFKDALAKLAEYEQRQEEQIQVGDEVISPDGKGVVTEISDRIVRIMYPSGSGYIIKPEELTKTGRHFPEIAEVFAKMKETDNG